MKTRRRKQSRALRGGSVSALPLKEMTGAEFKAGWSLNYIGSHGYTVEREFKIPKDTYLLFVAPSGEQCGVDKAAERKLFASLILKRRFDTEDEFWDAWLAVIKGAPSHNFGFELYNRTKPEPLSDSPKTVAIFEPGEMVKDQWLNFINDDIKSHFIDMGVYNLPLKPDHLDIVDSVQGIIKDKYTHSSGNIHVKDVPAITRLNERGTMAYMTRPDNLIKNPVAEEMLSTILEHPRSMGISFEAGKKRIFVINACRTPSEESVPKARHRRNSLSKRRYNAPAVTEPAAPKPAVAAAASKKAGLPGLKGFFTKPK